MTPQPPVQSLPQDDARASSSSVTPIVSVIMPVRNASQFLDVAISRVLSQSEPKLELIVVDDASTDGSSDIIDAAMACDSRVHLITLTEPAGVGAARNRALRLARGAYVWFTDADDSWSDTIVERLLVTAVDNDVDLVMSGARKQLPNGAYAHLTERTLSGLLDHRQLVRGFLTGAVSGHLWNKLIRRSLLPDGIFPETRTLSDLAGMVSIVASASDAFVVSDVLYTYHIRAGSILNSTAPTYPPDQFVAWRRCCTELLVDNTFAAEAQFFAYRYVFGYALNSVIRYATHAEPYDPITVSECRRELGFIELRNIFSIGGASSAISLFLMKRLWVLYYHLYRHYRRVRWRSVRFSG